MSAYTTFINNMLDSAFTGTKTMHLFTGGLPSGSGVEVTGGSYSAQTFAMSSAASKAKSASATITFTNLPTTGAISYYGVKVAGVLVDEGSIQPFTPDVTNNTLNISYTFNLAGA